MTKSIEEQMRRPDQTFGPVITEDSPAQDIARALVFNFARAHLDPSDGKHATFGFDEVYVVQFFYILGNWKALISTTLPDGMYYEVIYSKSRKVATLDAYKRFDHKEVTSPGTRDHLISHQAEKIVYDYAAGDEVLPEGELRVYTYSYAYVLGCWKSLHATSRHDDRYYEVTFDPTRNVAYLDPYRLFETKEFAIPARRGGD